MNLLDDNDDDDDHDGLAGGKQFGDRVKHPKTKVAASAGGWNGEEVKTLGGGKNIELNNSKFHLAGRGVGAHQEKDLLRGQRKELAKVSGGGGGGEEEDKKMCGTLLKNIEENFKLPIKQWQKNIDDELKDQAKLGTAIGKNLDKMLTELDRLLED